MLALILSKENPKLALAEADTWLGPVKSEREIFTGSGNNYARLAYLNKAISVISSGKTLQSAIAKANWNSHIRGSYAVRKCNNMPESEQQLADLVYEKLDNPVVELNKPEMVLGVMKGAKYYIGRLWTNRHGFDARRAHLRQAHSPVSLHPKLARACINLLGTKGTIMDPFCGTGGILLEAQLLGHNIVGFDLSQRMLEKAKKNLRSTRLITGDALSFDMRYKNIVTDLPYGRNSPIKHDKLYERFLDRINKAECNAVVMLPSTYKKKIKCAAEFSVYIHKSLSKRILFIKNH